ncbi:MAG TPA: hypothetical protein VIL85_14505 [Thermomicrobiales bacterium]
MVTARRITPEPARADDEPGAGLPTGTPGYGVSPTTPMANPTFGVEFWILGLAAALPTLLAASVLLACGGAVPLLPRLPVGITLGGLLIILALGTLAAHVADYPAWTHPGVVLIPILALFLPAAIIRGQVVTQINGDTDWVVVAPLGISWLLMLAATIVIAGVAVTIGRHAPSFSGLALLPVPLIQAWLLILAPPFQERLVLLALGSALVLTALATFAAWVVPTNQRPYVPLVAIGAQFGVFWLQRFGWPAFNGALRWVVALDIILYVALVALVAIAPLLAAWMRRAGWPTLRELIG